MGSTAHGEVRSDAIPENELLKLEGFMKQVRMLFILLAAVVSFKSWGVQPDVENWAPVFNGPPVDYIRAASVGGDYLWYWSKNKTLGAISLLTNTIVYTSTSEPFRSEDNYSITAGNEDCFIISNSAKFAIYRDGHLGPIDSTTQAFGFKVDANGTIRYMTGEEGRYKLYKYDGSSWDTVSLKIPYYGGGEVDYIVDTTGTLWVTSHWTESIDLYRIDGTKAIKITRDTSAAFTLLLDQQGRLRIRTNNAILTVKNDRIDTLLKLDNPNYNIWTAFDAQGNIWYIEDTLDGNNTVGRLIKRSMTEPASIKRYILPYGHNQSLFSKGFITSNPQGYYTLSFEDEKWTYVSFRSLTGNSCGEMFPGGKPYIFFEPGGSFFVAGDRYVSYYSTSKCYDFPIAPNTINSIIKAADGTIYIGTGFGLYHLDKSIWMTDTSLKSLYIKQLTVDRQGSIWGISDKIVFKQDGEYWQQITPSGNYGEYGSCTYIGTDSSGTIWLLKGNSVHSTKDGKSWISYDTSNSNLPAQQIANIYIDSKGKVHALFAKASADTTSVLFVASFDGTAWSIPKRIPFPSYPKKSLKKFMPEYSCIGSHDDIWVFFPPNLCKYQNDVWTVYDSTNSPFNAAGAIAENLEGEVYFTASYGATNTKYGLFKTVRTVAASRSLKSLQNTVTFSVRSIDANRCMLNYIMRQPGAVELSLFDMQGRHLSTLFSEIHSAGVFHRSVPIKNTPSGCYFVRLSTPDGSKVERVIRR
jgi:ligand-binding sensor domain-containing protein